MISFHLSVCIRALTEACWTGKSWLCCVVHCHGGSWDGLRWVARWGLMGIGAGKRTQAAAGSGMNCWQAAVVWQWQLPSQVLIHSGWLAMANPPQCHQTGEKLSPPPQPPVDSQARVPHLRIWTSFIQALSEHFLNLFLVYSSFYNIHDDNVCSLQYPSTSLVNYKGYKCVHPPLSYTIVISSWKEIIFTLLK